MWEALQRLTCSGVPVATRWPPASPALRSKVDQVIGAFDDLHVVLDDEQRVPLLQKAVKGPEQRGDVMKVQAVVPRADRTHRTYSTRAAATRHRAGDAGRLRNGVGRRCRSSVRCPPSRVRGASCKASRDGQAGVLPGERRVGPAPLPPSVLATPGLLAAPSSLAVERGG